MPSSRSIFAAGLAFGVLRFAASAMDTKDSLLLGVSLHGISFVLVFVTPQIYLNQRIDAAWRSRAQALLTLMNGGIGSLIGYLGTGYWFDVCTPAGRTHWPVFWGALAVAVGGVMIYFLAAYRGKEIKSG